MRKFSREILNAKPIEYMSSNGNVFKSDRGDLRNGVVVCPSWKNSNREIYSDAVEFGGWHSLNIHPNLNDFAGYDAIIYKVEDIENL